MGLRNFHLSYTSVSKLILANQILLELLTFSGTWIISPNLHTWFDINITKKSPFILLLCVLDIVFLCYSMIGRKDTTKYFHGTKLVLMKKNADPRKIAPKA